MFDDILDSEDEDDDELEEHCATKVVPLSILISLYSHPSCQVWKLTQRIPAAFDRNGPKQFRFVSSVQCAIEGTLCRWNSSWRQSHGIWKVSLDNWQYLIPLGVQSDCVIIWIDTRSYNLIFCTVWVEHYLTNEKLLPLVDIVPCQQVHWYNFDQDSDLDLDFPTHQNRWPSRLGMHWIQVEAYLPNWPADSRETLTRV